ncbi:MAG: 6-carboxytetrahydropterin synthase [archaeon]|jgi:6-pyruvoyltetrahydropterin/6-carboxytetrahydropterin synthase
MTLIKTSANFESAHRLSNYEGKCKRLHGHNWKVDLEVESTKLNEFGMVYDFTHLKIALSPFDHKILLKKNKENIDLFKGLPEDWICWLDFEPTAENLAIHFAEIISKETKKCKVTVRVWENEKSYAEETI